MKMSSKRRRANSQDNLGHPKAKRNKFTLEDGINLPETDKEGAVLVVGAGDFGQLGLGPDVLEKSRFALVDLSAEIVDVCAGGMHTVCLTKSGKVITFGCNDEGALGRVTDGNEDAEFLAGEVELPGKAVQICAGDSHTAALLEDGRVFAWGTFRDSHGNMGLTLKGNEKLPYEIIQNNHIVKIASGTDHIVFLTFHGEVWTCGCGEQGQLGRTTERGSGRTARSNVPKGQIAKLLVPAPISIKPSLKLHFDNIWAGNYGTMCKVANSNNIYVFGLNNYNQLGLQKQGPQFLPKLSKEFSAHSWILICCGPHHSIGLTDNNKVYVIGRKEYGRLGLGADCEDATQLTEVPDLKEKVIINVACGSTTSFAVTEKGELYGWGMGTNGQLGTGGEEDCVVPTLIKSKSLTSRLVHRVSSGGQHTVILTLTNNNNSENGK